jgi:predicted nucleic acid-binding protein
MKRRCLVRDVTGEIAVESARIKHKNKWGLGDSIIYATAIKENAKLLSSDRHFRGKKHVTFIQL